MIENGILGEANWANIYCSVGDIVIRSKRFIVWVVIISSQKHKTSSRSRFGIDVEFIVNRTTPSIFWRDIILAFWKTCCPHKDIHLSFNESIISRFCSSNLEIQTV